jgi:hypothetical protein
LNGDWGLNGDDCANALLQEMIRTQHAATAKPQHTLLGERPKGAALATVSFLFIPPQAALAGGRLTTWSVLRARRTFNDRTGERSDDIAARRHRSTAARRFNRLRARFRASWQIAVG